MPGVPCSWLLLGVWMAAQICVGPWELPGLFVVLRATLQGRAVCVPWWRRASVTRDKASCPDTRAFSMYHYHKVQVATCRHAFGRELAKEKDAPISVSSAEHQRRAGM